MARQTNNRHQEKFRKGKQRTDLMPSSISPPLLCTEWRRLRRNVNRRRKRGGASWEGLDESSDCCCWFGGDCEFDICVDESDWLNLSKNVLFRLIDVRLVGGVCTGDIGIGKVILGGVDDGIGIGLVTGWIIRVVGIAVVILVLVANDDDDDEGDVGDEAKYTVSVVIGER